jgi:hypothetical protein
MTKREWIKTTVVEPFPVFFSHVAYPSESRRETAKGPFYAANSETWDFPKDAAFCEWRAAGLREKGWTVTVERVLR